MVWVALPVLSASKWCLLHICFRSVWLFNYGISIEINNQSTNRPCIKHAMKFHYGGVDTNACSICLIQFMTQKKKKKTESMKSKTITTFTYFFLDSILADTQTSTIEPETYGWGNFSLFFFFFAPYQNEWKRTEQRITISFTECTIN